MALRSVVVCAVLATAVGHVHAERRPVAVISLSADADASLLSTELYRVLVAHPDLGPLGNVVLTAALQGPFEDENAGPLAKARQARTDSNDALRLAQPDFRNAQIAAERGMVALADVAPSHDELLGIYADLMFDLGQAHLGQRRPNDASLAFAFVRKLDPMRKPDPARYLPEIIDAYNAAASKPAGLVKVSIKGSGSVWIDGVEKGPPGTFEVTEGFHLVQLTGPDREPRGERILVPQVTEREIAPAPATEELKIKRARSELARAPDSLARASAIKKLAALLGVGDAIVISKVGDRLRVQTWRDREPGFSAIRERGSETPDELLAPLAPPRKVDPPREVPEPLPIVPETPWHKKRWVRASGVGVFLAATVAIVLYATRDVYLPNPNPDIQSE